MLLKSIDDDEGDDDEYAMKDLAFLRGLSGSAWCFGWSMMRVGVVLVLWCVHKKVEQSVENENYGNWCFFNKGHLRSVSAEM